MQTSHAEIGKYPDPALHIFKRETLGDRARIAAVQSIAREELKDATRRYNALEDMHDDAIAEVRRYRSPIEGARLTERERNLRLARSVRKLVAARDGLPCALDKMNEAAIHLIAVECEIDALGAD